MDKQDINKNIPIVFQKINEFDIKDTRFTKVKIWLMHLGENLNGSYFDEESVKKAIPSLANTPILTYIEDNSDGEKDCSDHREALVVENGEYKIKYLGQAVGVIPETNSAQFESRVCDDGIERMFLTCEGLVWNKWNDIQEIIERDTKKQQSMELHDDYDGVFGKDGLFHFTKFKFFGACMLGKDVKPAMRSASVELQDFSYKNFAKEIQSKLEIFKEYMKEKEEDIMDKEQEKIVDNVEEVKEVEETVKEEVVEKETEDKNELKEEIDVEESKENEEYTEKINSLSQELEALKEKYSVLEKENKELSEFKSSRLKEDREVAEKELFAQYEELKDVEGFNELKDNSSKFEKIEELEKELALLYVRNKKKFSTQVDEEKKTVKFQVEQNKEEDDGYGGLLSKYIG